MLCKRRGISTSPGNRPTPTLPTRLQRARSAGYGLPAAYTHEELGTMVGAGRMAVTRALGRLQDEGVVELRRRIIHVGDREAL